MTGAPTEARPGTRATPTETTGGPGSNGSGADTVEALLAELMEGLGQLVDGEFGARIRRREGRLGEVADRFNEVARQLENRSVAIHKISQVVGREGRMTERISSEPLRGTWLSNARAINDLIDDLTRPAIEIARVIAAVAEGDLTQHLDLDIEDRKLRGEFRTIGRTVNKMVDQLSSFADEVTRVAREVGTDGKLGGQADVRGVSGTWRDLTDSVNLMASNLTSQVRSISKTATAIASGDLSQTITVSARGEVAELADTINSLTATLRIFAEQVSTVAREVGTEGKLGGQAEVPGVAGTWKHLTDNVNLMASNLTGQVRNIAQVATAVASGDLSQKITVQAQGEILELKNTVNTMVDQLSSFADEVTRVAREVGTEGRLGGQAQVTGVSGTWRDLTENVNHLASNLTNQVRNIAQVTTAVARGDLSQKITVDARGEILELKSTINTMVDQLSSFADEVTRVAREVGSEGKLGGQAQVRGVSGTWRDLTDNVNSMASNLTDQVRNIAQVATAVASGDLSQKITVDARGEILELKSTVNTMVDQLSSFADEVTRVAREVGTEGRLGGQAQVRGVEGTWRDLTDNVNFMASNLTNQVRNIAHVGTAVARGDLSQKITVDAQGEILELKDTINTMVDQLSSFADEVTRVAREVGTEGKLGGQAQVRGVSGTWRDLTDNVNSMASNLTNQVRNIAMVTTSVARGDLSQKITVDAQGEILALKSTVNTMVDQLSSFADEVTRVAREVGTEGKLGGQAQVKGVSGTWRDLTESVNQLASTLTTQLRAIAQVSTAVTSGDLTQRVAVAARGEVADLKDNINQMIGTLRETTKKNSEQNWLDSNLARIGGVLQGQRDLAEVTRMIITEVAPLVGAQVGAFFVRDGETMLDGGPGHLRLTACYGYLAPETEVGFEAGEGLVGQAVASLRTIRVQSAPAEYLTVRSGLGSAPPRDILVLPIVFEGEPLGVIELASFATLSDLHIAFMERLVSTIGLALNTIMANRRTEDLLSQSQRLAAEMQEQSAELQRTNAELEEKAALLLDQKGAIEANNREIESARRGLEEKAQQLALASQYKSEFLANMSHELRTPLNSLLLLSRLLAENSEQNLTERQTEFARVIHRSGSDLLALIDDILDLSKIEAGHMSVQPVDVELASLRSYVESAFGLQAEEKGLTLEVELDPGLPAGVVTDHQRLQQILRNLMSNAVKFTHEGGVRLQIAPVPEARVFEVPSLDAARRVIAFGVQDSGIGISHEKLAIIFEAFQQADGTTSRKYGGTGLGLSISRELAKLLGGSIEAASAPGAGSTFTLYLPDVLPEVPATDGRGTQPAPAMLARLPVARETSAAPAAGTAVALPAQGPPPAAPSPTPVGNLILRQSDPDRRDGPSSDRLAGATVLIVDDDIRNVFALTSALELHNMKVLYSDNGPDGIAKLQASPEIDVVLMDAMMPGMDGNETTRAIREIPRFADLPIVFLTAKAMPGDREKALEAGASDYITKPVDLDELLDLLAAWVARQDPGGPGPGGSIARRGGKR